MDYVSTRNRERKVSAAYAIANGIAPDGGLYCPTSFPALTEADWKTLAESDYKGRSALILGKFLTDFSAEELADFAAKAYADEKFGGADTAPVVKLSEGKNLLELWHGPTCAFKDMALQVMPRLLSLALDKTGAREDAHILVATSGDTGVAALEGYKNVPRTRITVFYPANGVSDTQKRQMSTQEGENADVVAVRGDFDAAQTGVKRIFASESAAKRAAEEGCFLSSANSINWGRLVPQIVYYVHACVRLRAEGELAEGEKLDIAVPTGNFGNILAAYIAKRMGMPIGRLICASNENNVLADFINTGVYDRRRELKLTSSPSMDILVSSNAERLLFLLFGAERTRELMAALSSEGVYRLTQEELAAVRADFDAGFATETEAFGAISGLFGKYGYLCDTHTAVAASVAQRYRTGNKMLVVSTASPYKFAPAVLSALGAEVPSDGFEAIRALEELTKVKAPETLVRLREKAVRFSRVVDPAEMEEAVFAK